MALLAGTRLGSYDITALIGTGGKGEVYRAHDTKLDVAIKILPSEVAALRRFAARRQSVGGRNAGVAAAPQVNI